MSEMKRDSLPLVDNIQFSEIRPSTIHGKGLFATADIQAGAVLGLLDGQYVDWDEAWASAYEWNAIDENTLLIRGLQTKYSYINHSREPNLQIAYHPIRVVALKPITDGEEMTLDYRKEPLPEAYLSGHGASYL